MRNPNSSNRSDTPNRHHPDIGFLVIVALVFLTAAWLLATPWVPPVARATMERFHLRTGAFTFWAAQQPIPAMYNFANRYELRQWPAGLTDALHLEPATAFGTLESGYINHFPVRTATFANTRYRFLNAGEDRWLTVTSSYRGQTLRTRFHLKRSDTRGFDLIRVGDRGDGR